MSLTIHPTATPCQPRSRAGALCASVLEWPDRPEGPPACYHVHISKNSPVVPSPLVSAFLPSPSSLRTVLTLGTTGSRNGEIAKIDIFKHAARITRNNGTPNAGTPDRPRPDFDPYQRAAIARFFLDRNLPLPEYEQILDAFTGGARSPRGEIDHFSRKSKARLKHIAGNCFPDLISQFCLSYPAAIAPKNGRTAKRHLDKFLGWLRRHYPGIAYLWVLEFQKSGSPHFHLYLSLPRDHQKSPAMARAWAKITGAKGDELRKCINVHAHSKNFTRWEMKKGGYLTKYLDKQYQKNVPAHFSDVGRFWGNSRNLTCPSEEILAADKWEPVVHVDRITGETSIFDLWRQIPRILRRHHESTLRRLGRKVKSRIRNRNRGTVNLPSGGALLAQLLLWYDREKAASTGIADKDVPF